MARISGSQPEDRGSIPRLGTNERTSMKFKYKKRDYGNFIICVKMFVRPTEETLLILPKEEYKPNKYRYFGSADTYAEAVELKDAAYKKFLELKKEQDKK